MKTPISLALNGTTHSCVKDTHRFSVCVFCGILQTAAAVGRILMNLPTTDGAGM